MEKKEIIFLQLCLIQTQTSLHYDPFQIFQFSVILECYKVQLVYGNWTLLVDFGTPLNNIW